MKNKKILVVILIPVLLLVLLFLLFGVATGRTGYYLVCGHALNAVENLKLPEDCTVYFPTSAYASDIYWVHARAEKVVYCDKGEAYIKQYLEENNPSTKLIHIHVTDMGGMSDMDKFDFDNLPKEDQDRILNDGYQKYVRIVYEKKYPWFPTAWYFYDDVVAEYTLPAADNSRQLEKKTGSE